MRSYMSPGLVCILSFEICIHGIFQFFNYNSAGMFHIFIDNNVLVMDSQRQENMSSLCFFLLTAKSDKNKSAIPFNLFPYCTYTHIHKHTPTHTHICALSQWYELRLSGCDAKWRFFITFLIIISIKLNFPTQFTIS